ncbi:transcription initiation factor IIA subunit 2 [Cercophora newfieldiana]|uniref:Transcription initiation factor IIA subunit 2 n=1 Tax=Cercophora newfieldiana TaxID=92897 RepID=A0AA40CX57_9PEZI|nr:transcription initiation factor IIA subunit 2 [Cercophora newfieldiana]
MNSEPVYSELYRLGSLGASLIDAIDELVVAQKLEPQVGAQVLRQFDKTMDRGFVGHTKAKMTAKAKLRTYRLCDNVWTFDLRNVTFTMDNREKVEAKRMKIVAVSADPKDTSRKKDD